MSQGINNRDIDYVEPSSFGPRTLRVLQLSELTLKTMSLCYHFSTLGCATASRNPSSWRTKTRLPYTADTIAVDGLGTQGARAFAAIVLRYFSTNILNFISFFTINAYAIAFLCTCNYYITCSKSFDLIIMCMLFYKMINFGSYDTVINTLRHLIWVTYFRLKCNENPGDSHVLNTRWE